MSKLDVAKFLIWCFILLSIIALIAIGFNILVELNEPDTLEGNIILAAALKILLGG